MPVVRITWRVQVENGPFDWLKLITHLRSPSFLRLRQFSAFLACDIWTPWPDLWPLALKRGNGKYKTEKYCRTKNRSIRPSFNIQPLTLTSTYDFDFQFQALARVMTHRKSSSKVSRHVIYSKQTDNEVGKGPSTPATIQSNMLKASNWTHGQQIARCFNKLLAPRPANLRALSLMHLTLRRLLRVQAGPIALLDNDASQKKTWISFLTIYWRKTSMDFCTA